MDRKHVMSNMLNYSFFVQYPISLGCTIPVYLTDWIDSIFKLILHPPNFKRIDNISMANRRYKQD